MRRKRHEHGGAQGLDRKREIQWWRGVRGDRRHIDRRWVWKWGDGGRRRSDDGDGAGFGGSWLIRDQGWFSGMEESGVEWVRETCLG